MIGARYCGAAVDVTMHSWMGAELCHAWLVGGDLEVSLFMVLRCCTFGMYGGKCCSLSIQWAGYHAGVR